MARMAKRILMYRAKHGLAQRAFAEQIGISETTIVGIETGRLKTVSKLTKAKLELGLNEQDESTMTKMQEEK